MSKESFNKFKDNKIDQALNKYDENLGHITGKGSEVNNIIMGLKDKTVDLVSDFTAQGLINFIIFKFDCPSIPYERPGQAME